VEVSRGEAMKIRDAHAQLNGRKEEFTMPSGGLEIINPEDGKTLFRINHREDGSIQITAGILCRVKGKILDDALLISPVSSNSIVCQRIECED
jgi:hypothetical protein